MAWNASWQPFLRLPKDDQSTWETYPPPREWAETPGTCPTMGCLVGKVAEAPVRSWYPPRAPWFSIEYQKSWESPRVQAKGGCLVTLGARQVFRLRPEAILHMIRERVPGSAITPCLRAVWVPVFIVAPSFPTPGGRAVPALS